MSAFSIEILRELPFGSVDTVYIAIGAVWQNPIRQLLVQNYTNVELRFSDDGINDKFVLSAGTQFILDISTNKTLQNDLYQGIGRRLYVKYVTAAPTSGHVYVTGFYGDNGTNVGGNW